MGKSYEDDREWEPSGYISRPEMTRPIDSWPRRCERVDFKKCKIG